MRQNQKSITAVRGFTLIELLVVLGIMVVVAAVVLVALDPIRRFADARNDRRSTDVKVLLEAIKDNQIRSGGALIAGIDPTLRMIGKATSGCSLVCGGGTDLKTFNTQINSTNNDAEEKQLSGGTRYMYLTSTDLEFTYENGTTPQWVGMRFTGVTIPRGATIINAYLEFAVDETTSAPTSVRLYGQAVDNSMEFTSVDGNISNRPRTSAVVQWNNIPPWNTFNSLQQTPNLASLIQEVVNRPGWFSGNALVIVADGTGTRTAQSFDRAPTIPPKLFVEYRQAQTTQDSCLDLSAGLSEALNKLPVDPSNGSQDKTYYAVQALNPDNLRVVSCAPERGQNIELAR